MTLEEARVLLKNLNNQLTSAFYDGDFWVEEGTFEAFEVADAALREKAERERGCAYCMPRGGVVLYRCCPTCGRKLKEDAHE